MTAPFSGATINVTGGITLPDQVNLGIRHRLTDTLTLLGTAEWTRWSVLQNIVYTFTNGPASGTIGNIVNFTYRDNSFFSLGAEHRVLPTTTLRAGIGRPRQTEYVCHGCKQKNYVLSQRIKPGQVIACDCGAKAEMTLTALEEKVSAAVLE